MDNITVKQMATVMGITLTAVREGIFHKHFPFAYCYGKGKKRTFIIDRWGFETFLRNSGRPQEYIDKKFAEAGLM